MFGGEQKSGLGEAVLATITGGDVWGRVQLLCAWGQARANTVIAAELCQMCISLCECAFSRTAFLFLFMASCFFSSFSFLSLTFMMNNCLLLVIGRTLQAMNAFVAVNHFLIMSLMSSLCKNRISSLWHPKIG